MRKGVIVLVPFPFTDLSGQKVRPALVLYVSRKGENCIVAFITSAWKGRTYASDLLIPASSSNGLKMNSVAKLDHLATLQKSIVSGELGIVDSYLIKEVDKKLKILFALE